MKTAICLSAVLLMLAAPAYALEKPIPGKADSRIRYVNYNPNNIVELWTTPSGIMEIQFGADERVPEGNVAVADGANIGRKTRGNFLYLKLAKCIQPQPMLVTTELPDGKLRPYRFEIETKGADCSQAPPLPSLAVTRVSDGTAQAVPQKGDLQYPPVNGLAPGADVMYSVVFRYPEQERERLAALARERQAREQQAAIQSLLQKQTEAPGAVLDPDNGNRNYRYLIRGSANLTPASVWDNGDNTAFLFPANQRVPSIFRINPDGAEATVDFSVHHTESGGDTVIVSGTSQLWRLRDGKTVAELYNLGFNPMATAKPWTGTVSPYVQRVLKGDNSDGR